MSDLYQKSLDYCPFEVAEKLLFIQEEISSHLKIEPLVVLTRLAKKLIFEGREVNAKDNLTGALSKDELMSRLSKEIVCARRVGSKYSILLIDLDNFKFINDTFGHLKGDEILVEFAQMIKENLRQKDRVYRFGGDEFLVSLPGAKDSKVAERIRSSLSDYNAKQNVCKISVSIGIATLGEDGDTLEELIESADERMYEEKRSKKVRFNFFRKEGLKCIG